MLTNSTLALSNRNVVVVKPIPLRENIHHLAMMNECQKRESTNSPIIDFCQTAPSYWRRTKSDSIERQQLLDQNPPTNMHQKIVPNCYMNFPLLPLPILNYAEHVRFDPLSVASPSTVLKPMLKYSIQIPTSTASQTQILPNRAVLSMTPTTIPAQKMIKVCRLLNHKNSLHSQTSNVFLFEENEEHINVVD